MDEYSLLPSVSVGYQDLEAIKDAQGPGSMAGTFEFSIGYIRYDGTGELDHWYYKGLAELYTPIAGNFYAGLGYRRLLDDLGPGVSSTGALGYDRLSQYFYLPVGYLFNLEGGGNIKAQYNLFIEGLQTSYLTQAGYPFDPEKTQTSGYGFDLSYQAPSADWQAYARYWYIDNSEYVYMSGLWWVEPQNETIEIGVRIPF